LEPLMKLYHDPWGRLTFEDDAGSVHVGVEPVRAFPLSEPQRDISLLDHEGREVLHVPQIGQLPADFRAFLEEELGRRHFLPTIRRIHAIEGITEPTTWDVDTDRGRTKFRLRSEEDVRRVVGSRVIIVDDHGVRYLIADYTTFDATSRRLLEQYV
jgi:Domain of unknown function (DUF1854)